MADTQRAYLDPANLEVSFELRIGDDVWRESVTVAPDVGPHRALEGLAECANKALLNLGKEIGVFSR